jgi:hypothetical protein
MDSPGNRPHKALGEQKHAIRIGTARCRGGMLLIAHFSPLRRLAAKYSARGVEVYFLVKAFHETLWGSLHDFQPHFNDTVECFSIQRPPTADRERTSARA